MNDAIGPFEHRWTGANSVLDQDRPMVSIQLSHAWPALAKSCIAAAVEDKAPSAPWPAGWCWLDAVATSLLSGPSSLGRLSADRLRHESPRLAHEILQRVGQELHALLGLVWRHQVCRALEILLLVLDLDDIANNFLGFVDVDLGQGEDLCGCTDSILMIFFLTLKKGSIFLPRFDSVCQKVFPWGHQIDTSLYCCLQLVFRLAQFLGCHLQVLLGLSSIFFEQLLNFLGDILRTIWAALFEVVHQILHFALPRCTFCCLFCSPCWNWGSCCWWMRWNLRHVGHHHLRHVRHHHRLIHWDIHRHIARPRHWRWWQRSLREVPFALARCLRRSRKLWKIPFAFALSRGWSLLWALTSASGLGCFLPDAPRLCPWLLILVPFLRIVLGLALTLSMYVSTVEYILPRLVAAVGSRMPPQLPALKASPWSLVRHGTGDAAQEVLVLGVVPLQDVQDVRELLWTQNPDPFAVLEHVGTTIRVPWLAVFAAIASG